MIICTGASRAVFSMKNEHNQLDKDHANKLIDIVHPIASKQSHGIWYDDYNCY